MVLTTDETHGASLIDVVSPESWLQWSERYGAPLVALFVIGAVFYRGVRSVWIFFKPLITRSFDSFINLIDKQSKVLDGMDERQDRMEKLLASDIGGHEQTHQLIDKLSDTQTDTHRLVKDVHDKFDRN